jgi:uncharacterized protein YndB with AHSA1/START domain
MSKTITVESLVRASIDKVWAAYTTPDDIKAWNAASDDWHTTGASVDLRVGGKFWSRMEAKDGSAGFDFAGTYTRVEPNRRLDYVFDDRTASVTFAPAADGVLVRISFEAETIHALDQQREGWQAILANFAGYVAAKG